VNGKFKRFQAIGSAVFILLSLAFPGFSSDSAQLLRKEPIADADRPKIFALLWLKVEMFG
jgi:hypothetical protein